MSLKVIQRKRLIVICGNGEFECVLCNRRAPRRHIIKHDEMCVLSSNSVTGIRVDGVSGGVVFHPVADHKEWTSPASGAKYRIEKWPSAWVMLDESDEVIKKQVYLHTLRQWVGLNQGVL